MSDCASMSGMKGILVILIPDRGMEWRIYELCVF